MKPIAFLTALIFACGPLTVAAETTKTVVVTVPGGTQIPVKLLGSLSSANVKAGDIFPVQAADDVVVHGMVIVSAGARGQGTVERVDGAGGNGHSGTLGLNFDWVYAIDGGKIRLSNTPTKMTEEDRKGASSTATLVGIATFGIGGLFGHNFAHGRDVVMDGSKTLAAFVDSTIHVSSDQRGRSDHDQFDH